MTKETIDQEIARLSQVQPNDSDYAKVQLTIGLIFELQKKDIDKAIEYYQLVTHQDHAESYAQAQYRLGLIYEFDKKDIDKAIEYYQLVTHLDDDAYYYARAQYRLGRIFEFDKKQIDSAIKHYQCVQYLDNKVSYAEALLRLGFIFQFDKKDINKAIEYYQQVNHQFDAKSYARAQYYLGFISQFYKNDFDSAIEYYQQIHHQDNHTYYIEGLLRLGDIYYQKEQYNQAKDHYNNVSYIKDGFNMYAEAKIKHYFLSSDEIVKGGESKAVYLYDILPVVDNIKTIYNTCIKIREQLLVYFDTNNIHEQTIAHYTKPQVLFSLLKQTSPFRLNLIDFMNDPSENKVLFQWLNIAQSETYPDIKNFVASFSFNHNSLNQFRLYGLEDNVPGSGISLTLTSTFFGNDSDKSIDNEAINKLQLQSDNEQTIFPLPLYRCIYFDPNTQYLTLAKRSRQSFYLEHRSEPPQEINNKWQEYLDSLDEDNKIAQIRTQLALIQSEMKSLKELIIDNNWQEELKDINQLIALATMPIASLVKHAAFEDENECRLFYVTDIASDKVKIADDFNLCKQIYLEYGNITEHIEKVYLGPKCQPQHKLWIDNHSKKHKLNIRTVQSTMPLQ